MRQSYCIKQECLRKAQGAFLLAHKLGLLESPSMEGFEARRYAHNKMLKKLEQENKKFYGPRYFSDPAFFANAGSAWSGYVSPVRRYSNGAFSGYASFIS